MKPCRIEINVGHDLNAKTVEARDNNSRPVIKAA